MFLLLFATACLPPGILPAITNLIGVQIARHDPSCNGRTFDVTAPVIAPFYEDHTFLLLGDDSGVAQFNFETSVWNTTIRPGDILHVRGIISPSKGSGLKAECRTIDKLAHDSPPRPRPISVREFLSGEFDFKLTEIEGSVKDVFPDELDPYFDFIVLQSDGETFYATIRRNPNLSRGSLPAIGARISLVGVPMQLSPLNRKYLGRYFFVHAPEQCKTITSCPSDTFHAPDLRNVRNLGPQEISRLGRHRTYGQVLCVMHDGTFLLRDSSGLVLRVETDSTNAPNPNQAIEAVGFPESNLYHINLVRSIWRPYRESAVADRACPQAMAEDLSAQTRHSPVSHHGKLVRLVGKVLRMPDSSSTDAIMHLDFAGKVIPVDMTSLFDRRTDISSECTVEITGICVLDIGTWHPNAAFPRITGFTIVPRSDADIRIVARPPWWTPHRLFILLCVLIPIIIGSVILNFILRRLVERRSRALLREQSAKLAETLRVDERTRLAAELHDSVAQDLTGISMQIETAEDLAANAPEKLRKILGTASRSLLNCREELRNCLWDLRNHALDERNMGDAITRMLKPHLEGIGLNLRFNVPRNVVSDATAHATLQIIRELAANAIRHGHAKHLRICGTIDGKRLLFSVSDDGCGFDPDTAPGVAQGHFGLTGIRERVRKLGGSITIQSSPGNGTKITVTL